MGKKWFSNCLAMNCDKNIRDRLPIFCLQSYKKLKFLKKICITSSLTFKFILQYHFKNLLPSSSHSKWSRGRSGHSRSFSPAIAAISRPTLAQSRRFLAHFARRLRAQIFWLYVWVPFCLLQCEIASVLFYLTSASLSCWCTVVPPAVQFLSLINCSVLLFRMCQVQKFLSVSHMRRDISCTD